MDKQQQLLTIEQTDELILNAATPDHGAIEDCEESGNSVMYHFIGYVGVVNRVTAEVKFIKG